MKQRTSYMGFMLKALSLSLLLVFISMLLPAQSTVIAEKAGNRINFHINGVLFTSYIISEHEKYPFFFPVNGPSKASVTSIRNGNYPHHSSLFFGCDHVNGGNYWQESLDEGQIIAIRTDIIQSGGEKAVIENECIWRRKGVDSPIKDKRVITVSAPSANKYIIDFEVTMEMLMDVTIGKTNHSLFSIRMAPDLTVTNGGTIINAEGETTEKGTFGKTSAWVDFHGMRMGKTEGIAILQHPSSKWYPSKWFTRDYGFFSPTPMYWPENDKSLAFKKGEQIFLRYRVIVHSGNHIEANIEGEFESFSNE